MPERQTEPHTCGLHALNSLYRAYGLDPGERRLRFRLGTDKPFTNFVADSTGTVHPDMLRVLHQDGFETDLVDPSSSTASDELAAHLDAGHYAVALSKPAGFHWVLLTGRSRDDATVCDSLSDAPYDVPLEGYVRGRLYSIVLVSPAPR
jgi:hypothetical protein